MEFYFSFIFFCVGAMLASFVGVISERLHTGEPWLRGRSRCNSCGKTLRSFDLVPIISWLLSFGRCRACGSRIPASYLAFEIIVGTLFVLAYQAIGLGFALSVFLAALVVLAFIVLYDIRHTIVPPTASALLTLTSCVYAYLALPSLAEFGPALFTAGVIGAGFFAFFFFSGGKAMGLGDAPVAFALSLLVAPYAFPGVLFSFWIGAAVGILILFTRRGGPRMGIEVPFVPFLAAGFLLAYFIQWNPLSFF